MAQYGHSSHALAESSFASQQVSLTDFFWKLLLHCSILCCLPDTQACQTVTSVLGIFNVSLPGMLCTYVSTECSPFSAMLQLHICTQGTLNLPIAYVKTLWYEKSTPASVSRVMIVLILLRKAPQYTNSATHRQIQQSMQCSRQLPASISALTPSPAVRATRLQQWHRQRTGLLQCIHRKYPRFQHLFLMRALPAIYGLPNHCRRCQACNHCSGTELAPVPHHFQRTGALT